MSSRWASLQIKNSGKGLFNSSEGSSTGYLNWGYNEYAFYEVLFSQQEIV